MEKRFLYFAYGSNMDKHQMEYRCPGAICLGVALLNDYTLVERKYADIDKCSGKVVPGLLWSITINDLLSLDLYEGFPQLYTRKIVEVEVIKANTVNVKKSAIVYEMTPKYKDFLNGECYSEDYRQLCSNAAEEAGIENNFNTI